jgi:tetratricopeptide (TPR) repeat protein
MTRYYKTYPSYSVPKKKTSKGCIVALIIAIVIGSAICVLSNTIGKSAQKTSSGTELIGHDPHAFENASALYSLVPQTLLTKSDYTDLKNQFVAYVDQGLMPENPEFRQLLLRLNGSPDMKDANNLIESNITQYVTRIKDGTTAVNTTMQTNFTAANSYYQSGEFDQAANAYIQILDQNPGHLDARNNLGLCDLHNGNYFSAIMQFNLVLAVSPKYYGAEQNLSVALEQMGLSDEAMNIASKLVKDDANLPMAQYNLGWFQTKTEKFSDADKSYAAALKLIATYPLASRALALNKIANGEKLSAADLKTLSTDEKNALDNVKKVAPTAQTVTATKTNTTTSATTTTTKTPKRLTTWVFWLIMVVAILLLILLTAAASGNYNDGAAAWGVFSIIILVIAVVVFAIWFNTSVAFSTIIWIFTGLDFVILVNENK